MKSAILVLQLVMIVLTVESKEQKHKIINFKAIESADMLNTWIRNRGTYIYQLLNVPADEAKGKEQKAAIDLLDPVSYADPLNDIMNSDRIELPDVCDKKWSASELASVLEKAGELMTNWIADTPDAAKTNKELFNKMPNLNAEQFAKFYGYLAAGAKLPTTDKEKAADIDSVTRKPIVYFSPEDATKDSAQLLKEVNQDWAGKFDAVPWLQFWAYMCLNGKITKNQFQEYLSPIDLRPGQSQGAVAEQSAISTFKDLPQALKPPVVEKTVVPPTAKNMPPQADTPKEEAKKPEAPKKLKSTKNNNNKNKRLINVTQTVHRLKKRSHK